MWNPITCDCKCKKHILNELVLTWEDEIVNTSETMLINSQKILLFYSHYFISNCIFIFVM